MDENVTNQNILPVQPSNAQPSEQQKISSNISWLKTLSIDFTLVSFGIAIGIGGYILATQKNQPTPQNQQAISPTPSPTEVSTKAGPTIDPAVSWKTYTNNEDKYSIKYPSYLKIEVNPNQSLTGHSNQKYTQVTLKNLGGNSIILTGFILIAVTTIPPNISIPVAIEKNYSGVGAYMATQFKKEDFEDIVVDGLSGLGNQAPAQFNAYDVHLIKDNKLYALRIESTSDLSKSNKEKQLFDQILSTFQFSN